MIHNSCSIKFSVLPKQNQGRKSANHVPWYLDLLSDNYAIARWVYLRRFSPFNYTTSKAPTCTQNDDATISFSSPETSIGRYVIHVQNTTNTPQLLKFSSDYGIMVNWKEAST